MTQAGTGDVVAYLVGDVQLPAPVRRTLKAVGDNEVVMYQISRVPIDKAWRTLLKTVFKNNKVNSNIQKYGYDTLYHLYIQVLLDNGTWYRIERGQNITMTKGLVKPKRGVIESLPVIKAKNPHSIRDWFFYGSREAGPDLWRSIDHYDPRYQTCQTFVTIMLKANGNRDGLLEVLKFVNQPLDKIMGDSPWLSSVVGNLVSTIGLAQNVVEEALDSVFY